MKRWFLATTTSVLLSVAAIKLHLEPVRSSTQGTCYVSTREMSLYQGRLVSDSSYAPYIAIRPSSTDKRDLRRSFSERGPQALASLARIDLVNGNVSKAVQNFESAAGIGKPRPAILSDLAAAYLARAEVGGDAYDFVLALNAADEAIQLAPSLQEAHFNRALAMTRLFMPLAARAAWKAYLQLDNVSPWAQKARTYLWTVRGMVNADGWDSERQQLIFSIFNRDMHAVARIVKKFPQASREYAEDELTVSWAESYIRGDKEGERRVLKVIKAISNALTHIEGDYIIADEVALIEAASVSREGQETLDRLSEGYNLYVSAKAAYQKSPLEASDLFRQARQRLRPIGSRYAAWSTIWLSICQYQSARYEEVLKVLEELRYSHSAERYPILTARSWWITGLTWMQSGNLGRSLSSYHSALKYFQEAGEIENVASVKSRLSLVLRSLGDNSHAWSLQHEALSRIGEFRERSRLGPIFEIAAFQMLENRCFRVASYYQDEFVRLAQAGNDPVSLAEALQWRAESRARLGNLELALGDLATAMAHAVQIQDSDTRRAVEADIYFREGSLLAGVRPIEALNHLGNALSIYKATDYNLRIPHLRLARSLAYIGQNDIVSAEDELDAGIQEFEHIRIKLPVGMRSGFFEVAGEVFDHMVQLQLKSDDFRSALDYLERSRSRSLLDFVVGSSLDFHLGKSAEPLKSAAIQTKLPPDTALVEYMTYNDTIFFWVVTKDEVVLRHTRLRGKNEIELLARTVMVNGRDEVVIKEAAARLYEILISPIFVDLRGSTNLVLIPDKYMYGTPFAALWSQKKDRFLVEDYSLVVAPSASVYLEASNRLRNIRMPIRSILAIGDPAFDRRIFPSLPRLPEARKEAASVVKPYSTASVLLGDYATVASFMRKAPLFNVVHLASHAQGGGVTSSPILILADMSSSSPGGTMSAEQISSLRFTKTHLVVLSSCASGLGRLLNLEGIQNLARPFLSAGVPAVVVSLGDVNDVDQEEFWFSFHSHFVAGRSPSLALRSAQLEAISSSGRSFLSVRQWAAFEVIGGS